MVSRPRLRYQSTQNVARHKSGSYARNSGVSNPTEGLITSHKDPLAVTELWPNDVTMNINFLMVQYVLKSFKHGE